MSDVVISVNYLHRLVIGSRWHLSLLLVNKIQ